MSRAVKHVVIVGAAGRDFHDFNVVYRERADVRVVAFTAAQIPNIAGRRYPAALAGPLYPDGIPIVREAELAALVAAAGVAEVVFAYSDVPGTHVMSLASVAQAAGADFVLLGPQATMLPSRRPVVAVVAVRTGCGKSQTSRAVAAALRQAGLRVAVVRHPMPYGDLATQAVQRFEHLDDLARHACTVEEREEYEPHIEAGSVVFAGVDYARILAAAEAEADVILWDGGNNDLPFYRPDLTITLVDPLRAGDERTSWPGSVNLRMADVVIIAKVDVATDEDVAAVRQSISEMAPRAQVIEAASPVRLDDPEKVRGRRAVVVEDGPTLTHGGMAFGAGTVAAQAVGATVVDPRPYAVGSLRETFAAWPKLGAVLPAMGYGDAQIADLAATLRAAAPDVVVAGTPMDLAAVVGDVGAPIVRARYDLAHRAGPTLEEVLAPVIAHARSLSPAKESNP